MGRGLRRLALTLSLAGAFALSTGAVPALAQTDVDLFPGTPNSELDIFGEADADLINVSLADNTITITDVGPGGITTDDPDCGGAPVNPATVICPFDPPGVDGPVAFMFADLFEGSDVFANQNLLAETGVDPGDGDDTVQSGPADFDDIAGDPGNDSLDAGEGNDFLDASGPGADLLNGGPGDDELGFDDDVATGVNITLDDQANDGAPGEGDNVVQIEDVFGTEFDDSLTGNAVANELGGGPGDDALTGLAGNDALFGNDGDDLLNGGASPDGSADLLSCGDGLDVALAEPLDVIEANCERRGAAVVGDTAKVSRKGTAKVRLACAPEEGTACAGSVALFSNGKEISKVGNSGAFDVPPGGTANAKVKLTDKGKRAVRRGGGALLVTAQAETVEPGGVSISEGRVLLTQKAKQKKNKN
jgi:hypothetical protein